MQKQVGLYANFPGFWERGQAGTVVEPKQLPRAKPAVFAGPFLVEMDEQYEYAPHAVGSLAFRVQAFGLPPVVVEQLWNPTPPFTILEAVDSKGRDLRDMAKTFPRQRTFKRLDDAFERSYDVYLKNLLKDSLTADSRRSGGKGDGGLAGADRRTAL